MWSQGYVCLQHPYAQSTQTSPVSYIHTGLAHPKLVAWDLPLNASINPSIDEYIPRAVVTSPPSMYTAFHVLNTGLLINPLQYRRNPPSTYAYRPVAGSNVSSSGTIASLRIQNPSPSSAGSVYVKLRMNSAPMKPDTSENCGTAAPTTKASTQYTGITAAHSIFPAASSTFIPMFPYSPAATSPVTSPRMFVAVCHQYGDRLCVMGLNAYWPWNEYTYSPKMR
ncbi:hypothetical protein Ct61P_01952 [Colletotrichum tofieldiae]|nr:hypothetical protein Ct61P_01952 [Colletotrichum tofieldiae]